MMIGTIMCACGRPISANKEFCARCAERPGELSILNVGAGDVKITFNRGDVAEVIRAKRIITDMLRRGFALVVEVERNGEKAYERVESFDEKTGEYLICDFDPLEAARLDAQGEPEAIAGKPAEPASPADTGKSQQRGRPSKRLPMEKTRATAVGRSAGG